MFAEKCNFYGFMGLQICDVSDKGEGPRGVWVCLMFFWQEVKGELVDKGGGDIRIPLFLANIIVEQPRLGEQPQLHYF